MKTSELIAGQNVKTLLPIKYIPPIWSESIVRSSSNNKPSYKYQENFKYDDDDEIILYDKKNNIQFFETTMNFTGKTHLSNKGLFEDKSKCCVNFSIKKNVDIGISSIYDPRFYGYCTDEWRTFKNPLLGRIEYDYSDVNLIKLPQYIERNNLDVESVKKIGSAAVKHFADVQIEQRQDLQNEWLKRRQSDRLQQKLFPLHTNGNKTS